MTAVGQIEKRTQTRIVALFQQRLGYDYLGDNTDRGNRNIEPTLLTAWLTKQKVGTALVTRALHELNKAATDTSKSLYDRNREVYELLRYGVKVLFQAICRVNRLDGDDKEYGYIIDYLKSA